MAKGISSTKERLTTVPLYDIIRTTTLIKRFSRKNSKMRIINKYGFQFIKTLKTIIFSIIGLCFCGVFLMYLTYILTVYFIVKMYYNQNTKIRKTSQNSIDTLNFHDINP
jgi:hypothetical protein